MRGVAHRHFSCTESGSYEAGISDALRHLGSRNNLLTWIRLNSNQKRLRTTGLIGYERVRPEGQKGNDYQASTSWTPMLSLSFLSSSASPVLRFNPSTNYRLLFSLSTPWS